MGNFLEGLTDCWDNPASIQARTVLAIAASSRPLRDSWYPLLAKKTAAALPIPLVAPKVEFRNYVAADEGLTGDDCHGGIIRDGGRVRYRHKSLVRRVWN